MFKETGDEGYLTRPHCRLVRRNAWCTEWEESYEIPNLAKKIYDLEK